MKSTIAASQRSVPFKKREHGRYWWFQTTQADYTPPIFAMLDDDEWRVMLSWYEETERDFPAGTGECNVPAMSMLLGLVMGNNISRIVQCGHFIGFSTLILGFMARRMGHKHSIYSVDIDARVTEVTRGYVRRAKLDDYVMLRVGDSADPQTGPEAAAYLRGAPQVVFIDSSYEAGHTLRELGHWFPQLQPGGFLIMHDVSDFAVAFAGMGNGGVKSAVSTWAKNQNLQLLMINDFAGPHHHGDRTVYKDACGLGIIQKPS